MAEVGHGTALRIAVLSLTRDRLDYTRRCFTALREYAGCDFDHYIFDQASTDGTQDWLFDYDATGVWFSPANVGISRAMNKLLEVVRETRGYDVIVKFDNDCLLSQPGTLRDVCRLAIDGGALLSPRILGLNNPPRPTGELRIGEEMILDVPQIGGIFLAAPAWLYDEFRYSETNPPWGMDDVEVCRWWRARGGTCGYVKRLEAWHYETTGGQQSRYPAYFDRKRAEMAW